MIRREEGFTMVELLLTMTLFLLAMMAATNIFVPLLTQFKQQSKVAETQIEGAVGLEILRRDIEQAGFGLPWVVAGVTYQEGSSATSAPIPAPNDSKVNDSGAATNPPRPIVSINENEITGTNKTDYLVIKATSVATNDAASRWTHIVNTGATIDIKKWNSASEDLNNGDRVIAIIPTRGGSSERLLVYSGTSFSTQFSSTSFPSAFAPGTLNDIYLIYGVDRDTDLRMPFNRADYYIRKVSGTNIPPRCAKGTGILMKSVINHANGESGPGMPIMDCVADFQVVYGMDISEDGFFEPGVGGDTFDSDISDLNAQQIRTRLKEVRIYILAHEGQKDPNLTYPNKEIKVPADPDPGASLGSTFKFDERGIEDWQRYRWKVYTLVVKPKNLRQT